MLRRKLYGLFSFTLNEIKQFRMSQVKRVRLLFDIVVVLSDMRNINCLVQLEPEVNNHLNHFKDLDIKVTALTKFKSH